MIDLCCVLEWENVRGIERAEARNFLNKLIINLDKFENSTEHAVELMIIYDESVERNDLE